MRCQWPLQLRLWRPAPVALRWWGCQSGGGAALIAIDGQPAKPFRVGATVDAGLVLQSLGQGQVQLGASRDGPAALTLQIPKTP